LFTVTEEWTKHTVNVEDMVPTWWIGTPLDFSGVYQVRVDVNWPNNDEGEVYFMVDEIKANVVVPGQPLQGTPVAGMMGLGLVAAACALGGALTLRRKK